MLELINVKEDGTRTIVGKMSNDDSLMIDGLNNALIIKNINSVNFMSDLEAVLDDTSTQVYRAVEDDDHKLEFFINVTGYRDDEHNNEVAATISVHHPVLGVLITQEFNTLELY